MVLRQRLRFRLARPHRREVVSLGAAVAACLVLEALGRRIGSDAGDLLAVLLLAATVTAFAAYHREAALVWVHWLGRPVRRAVPAVAGWKVTLGVDFRGEPPVPSGLPRALRAAALVTTGVALVAALAIAVGQTPRQLIAPVSYVLYLAGLAVGWSSLVACALVSIVVAVVEIHDHFATSFHVERRRRAEAVSHVTYFTLVLLGGLFLPLWVPAVLLGATFLLRVVGTRALLPAFTLLWLHRPSGRIRSLDWRVLVSLVFSIALVLAFAIALTATGPVLVGGPDTWGETMPLTRKLGAISAWLAGCGLLLDAVAQTARFRRARRSDPADPAPTTVYVHGVTERFQQRTIRSLLLQRGWQARFPPHNPMRTDVQLELVAPPLFPPQPGEPNWPLKITLDQLGLPDVLERIARRDQIQRRRVLLRGLRRLLRNAARRRYRKGTGYWLALHHWFVLGLTRDTDEDELSESDGAWESGVIGPYYHSVLPQPVRHHFWQLCRDLEIDLILMEDGVGFRGLRRVLKGMFEHHDVHAGRRRIEEMHFTGLGGLRVILHDFEQTKPLDRKRYPEPDYEDVGRARVLHIFKDRGEDEEEATDPIDFDSLLLPRGLGLGV